MCVLQNKRIYRAKYIGFCVVIILVSMMRDNVDDNEEVKMGWGY